MTIWQQAFCAGGDVVAIREDSLRGSGTLYREFFKEEYAMNLLISEMNIVHKIPQVRLSTETTTK